MKRTITDIIANGVEGKELWYDWFCKDTSLPNKTKALMSRVRKIVKLNNNKKFHNDDCYVFFKNNCPCSGSLYDDFRICDLKTGDVIYTVIPKSGHYSNYGESELWGKDNDFKEPIIKGSWMDICNYFL